MSTNKYQSERTRHKKEERVKKPPDPNATEKLHNIIALIGVGIVVAIGLQAPIEWAVLAFVAICALYALLATSKIPNHSLYTRGIFWSMGAIFYYVFTRFLGRISGNELTIVGSEWVLFLIIGLIVISLEWGHVIAAALLNISQRPLPGGHKKPEKQEFSWLAGGDIQPTEDHPGDNIGEFHDPIEGEKGDEFNVQV